MDKIDNIFKYKRDTYDADEEMAWNMNCKNDPRMQEFMNQLHRECGVNLNNVEQYSPYYTCNS
jgi:hypothetical protein